MLLSVLSAICLNVFLIIGFVSIDAFAMTSAAIGLETIEAPRMRSKGFLRLQFIALRASLQPRLLRSVAFRSFRAHSHLKITQSLSDVKLPLEHQLVIHYGHGLQMNHARSYLHIPDAEAQLPGA